MTCILYNPLANNGKGKAAAGELSARLGLADVQLRDLTAGGDLRVLFSSVAPEDRVIVCGGDGTLNRLVNDLAGELPDIPLWYAPGGSGNDFYHDVQAAAGPDGLLELNPYLRDLPVVTVNGQSYRFLNNVGFGIDGYCCEEGDRRRAASDKPINYTAIAIQGLLFRYKPVTAEVTVDGVTRTFHRVWLAPTMNGRFYGGGMMITPAQDRLNRERSVSVCLMHTSGKLRTLMVFPSIFKGAHVKHEKIVTTLTGHDVSVRFDRPCALQIDGETILGVTSYSVKTRVPAKVKQLV